MFNPMMRTIPHRCNLYYCTATFTHSSQTALMFLHDDHVKY